MTDKWIWERPDWPNFEYDEVKLSPLLEQFDHNNQLTLDKVITLDTTDANELIVSIKGREALETSRIEGEDYPFISLKESFRIHASIISKDGLPNRPKSLKSHMDAQRRSGISEMMGHLYRKFGDELSHETLHSWNKMIIQDNKVGAGKYRDYAEPMQVKSFSSGKEVVDFEAPPATPKDNPINGEMDKFVEWYNDTAPNGSNPLHPVIRAGLAHLHFVTIHPYTDGNGRISRALSIKAISEHNGEPTLVSLSHAISDSKSEYYDALKKATKDHDVQSWLNYFAKTVVRGQEITKEKIYFAALSKTHQQDENLNERQKKTLEAIIDSRYGGTDGKPAVKNPDKFGVSDYITLNRDALKVAAQEQGITPKEMAERDLTKLKKNGIIEEVASNGGAKYQIVFPNISGLSEYMDPPKRRETGPTIPSDNNMKVAV